MTQEQYKASQAEMQEGGVDLREVKAALAKNGRLILLAPLLAGLLSFGATYLVTPTFSAKTIFLPPQQQQQGSALAAVSSLGSLSGLAGGLSGVKNTGDQYVSLMRSANVEDRIIDRFQLMKRYDVKYRFQARKKLDQSVRIELGKKDGLISVEVDADDPKLAADMANQHVAELRRLTEELALTEAQQRRIFFERELKQTRDRLAEAQQALQNSGFNAGALKAEPKSAAEAYATLQAQATAAEVRLQTLRESLAESAPEVKAQVTQLSALRSQITKLEGSVDPSNTADYIGRYREFKYQETLFDLFSKQYETARLDESRDGGMIQVVDVAVPPELKSKPKRALIAILAVVGMLLATIIASLLRHFWGQGAHARHRAIALQRDVI